MSGWIQAAMQQNTISLDLEKAAMCLEMSVQKQAEVINWMHRIFDSLENPNTLSNER